jgi:hypothetical protein
MGQKNQPPPLSVIEKARIMLREKAEAERRRVERYGEVRPIVTTEAFGKRLVVVRNLIYGVDKKKYFGDFLRDFVVEVFGVEWSNAETAKPESERHLVVQWRIESARYMNAQPEQPDGSRKGILSGIVAAFMGFAYGVLRVYSVWPALIGMPGVVS